MQHKTERPSSLASLTQELALGNPHSHDSQALEPPLLDNEGDNLSYYCRLSLRFGALPWACIMLITLSTGPKPK